MNKTDRMNQHDPKNITAAMYEDFRSTLYGICKARGINPNEYNDTVQDIWMRVMRTSGNFNANKGSLKNWMRMTANSLINNQNEADGNSDDAMSKGRMIPLDAYMYAVENDEEIEAPLSDAGFNDPAMLAMTEEDHAEAQVTGLMNEVFGSERDKEIFLRHYMDGEQYDAIAIELCIDTQTCRKAGSTMLNRVRRTAHTAVSNAVLVDIIERTRGLAAEKALETGLPVLAPKRRCRTDTFLTEAAVAKLEYRQDYNNIEDDDERLRVQLSITTLRADSDAKIAQYVGLTGLRKQSVNSEEWRNMKLQDMFCEERGVRK